VLGRRHEQEDLRTFIREILLRHDRATEAMLRRYDEGFRQTVAEMETNRAQMRALTAEVREGRDEQLAQTQALLRLIDEMRGGGPEPAGA